MSNYGLDGLRHWLKSEYDLNGLYFADIGIWDTPIIWPLADFGSYPELLKYSYRASRPIPTTFIAIRAVKKNPIAYLDQFIYVHFRARQL